MINLKDETEYFILVDGQGGSFGGGRILEGKDEVFEQFAEWADNDDINITDFAFSDLIEVWNIYIKKYDGKDFVDLTEAELDYKRLNKINYENRN